MLDNRPLLALSGWWHTTETARRTAQSTGRRFAGSREAGPGGMLAAIWPASPEPTARPTDLPNTNPYNAAPRSAFDALAKRGVQFMVCDTASHRFARMLAGSGDGEAVYKEMAANLIPSSRYVPAGVIGTTRAQEYGYSRLFVG